jgi:hypothetical protein
VVCMCECVSVCLVCLLLCVYVCVVVVSDYVCLISPALVLMRHALPCARGMRVRGCFAAVCGRISRVLSV